LHVFCSEGIDSSWDNSNLGLKSGVLVLVSVKEAKIFALNVAIVARDWVSSNWVSTLDGWSVLQLDLLELTWWDLIMLVLSLVVVIACLEIS